MSESELAIAAVFEVGGGNEGTGACVTKQVSCVELVNRQIKECEAANDHCQVSAHHDADARRARWDEGAVAAPECASSLGEKAMDGSINCDANVD